VNIFVDHQSLVETMPMMPCRCPEACDPGATVATKQAAGYAPLVMPFCLLLAVYNDVSDAWCITKPTWIITHNKVSETSMPVTPLGLSIIFDDMPL